MPELYVPAYSSTQKMGGERGSIKDVFHPQARYFHVNRIDSETLLIEGNRPRAFGCGVKRFRISIVPKKVGNPDWNKPEAKKDRMDSLEKYISRN